MTNVFQPSTDLQKAWDRFKGSANWQILHPLDVDRFYQFVWMAYQEGHSLGDLPMEQFIKRNCPSYAHDNLIRRLEQARDLLDVVTGRGRRA
ncbi:hypothetical protein [Paracoccus haematequi]|uniref:hypothetical protein n=1 Tax=Paracoccus haematequi TaxID=2491866 RepID=UPI000F7ECDF2|nr:hypothetical protein [Paracoccus haematequi]